METIKIKKDFLKKAKAHKKADRFIQGNWINEKLSGAKYHRGCFFGCMLQTGENTLRKASEEMRMPLWLVHLSERLFEGVKKEDAVNVPTDILKADLKFTENNGDYQDLYNKFFYSLLMDAEKGQITFTEKGSEQYTAIEMCAELFRTGDYSNATAARSAAESAAWSAWSAGLASSAARSAAESAAWSAAESAAGLAESASSAASSAARSAESAESSHYQWLLELLIKLMNDETV